MKHKDLRAYKRTPVTLPAYLITKDTTYKASIKNVSEYGLNIQFCSTQNPVIFYPESNLDIVLQISANEKLLLSGKKRWVKAISTNKPYKEIGIEISSPSIKYKEFVGTQIQTF